jgi:hypothetical protein
MTPAESDVLYGQRAASIVERFLKISENPS